VLKSPDSYGHLATNFMQTKNTITDSQARRSGVYILCQKDRVCYVGETGHFRKRIQHHSWTKRFGIDKICFRPVEDHRERLVIEQELIEQLSPAFNKLRQYPQPRDAATGKFTRAA
jgi:excinuclease UvrABC nuclease subunit